MVVFSIELKRMYVVIVLALEPCKGCKSTSCHLRKSVLVGSIVNLTEIFLFKYSGLHL